MTPAPDDAHVIYLRSYGDRDHHETVGRVLDATVDMIREMPYSAITTRSIAERAGVGHRDLCAFFRSTNAIVAEVYLELLRDTPLVVDVDQPTKARVTAQFDRLMSLLADEPAIAAACSSALISPEASVRTIRQRIHQELHRLIGALVNASCAGTFRDAPADLANVVISVLPEEH